MGFFSNMFAKLFAPAPVDLATAVKNLYPDALVLANVFPNSPVNLNFVVLPSVSGGLPDNLKNIITNNDNKVEVVFFGGAAQAIVAGAKDPAALANIFAEKVLANTNLDEKLKALLEHATAIYNAMMPGQNLTPEQLVTQVVGMVGVLLAQNSKFQSADDFYKALVANYLTSGKLAVVVPQVINEEMSKLGIDKLQSNPMAQVAMTMLAGQINSALEQAFKGMGGDIQVF